MAETVVHGRRRLFLGTSNLAPDNCRGSATPIEHSPARLIGAAKKRGDRTAALDGYREALRLSERMEQALRLRVLDVGVWLAVCRTLRDLGREQEADEALVRARDGAREQKMPAPEWEKALREEGL